MNMPLPPEPDFSLEDLLKELNERANIDDGLTRKEIEKATGMKKYWVLEQLHELNNSDRLIVVSKKIRAIDGRTLTVPAYRLKGNNSNEERNRERRCDNKGEN